MSSASAGKRDRQTTASSQRVTVRLDVELLEAVDDLESYPNRSEAIRAGVRQLVERETRGEGGD